MPLTFAHPALILPLINLLKRYVSATGLIIGSMVPDLEKLARAEAESKYSHTWAGIFWFNLPVALVLSFIFHLLVREPLINHLPAFLRNRFYRFREINWKKKFKENYGLIILSIILGAASHLLWDSFTNKNGYFVQHIPFLTSHIRTRVFKIMPCFVIVYHLSSLVGALIVLYSIFKLPAKATLKPGKPIITYWFIVALIAGCILFLRLAIDPDISHQASNLILTAIYAILISLTITSSLSLFRKTY